MGIKASTALRKQLLDTGSLRSILNLGFIKLYSGAPPADADQAVTGTLLATISVSSNGTGITFAAAASGGTISKNASEVWSGVVAAGGGTAGYYRHVAPGDDGTLNTTTQPRIQGTVAQSGGDMNISNPTLTAGATQTIDYYSIALPAF